MSPTLQEGDRILVDRTADFGNLERGDLIVFRRRDQLIVKRVVGLPGEEIEGRGRIVAIDRTRRLDEPYAFWGGDNSSFDRVSLDNDEVWVMGDNRDASRDSRNFGPVRRSALVGVVRLVYWPPTRWGRAQ